MARNKIPNAQSFPSPGPSVTDMFLDEVDREEHEVVTAIQDAAGTDDFALLIQYAEEMKTEKEEKERLEAEAKEHADRYNELRKNVIPDLMRALGVVKDNGKGSFTFAGGKVHLETKVYASCSKANEERFFAWCRLNGHGDLIKESVNAQTLSAVIRERRGEGLEDPPGISTHEEVVAKMTK